MSEIKENKRFCTKCGKEIQEHLIFCPKCGQRIIKSGIQNSEVQNVAEINTEKVNDAKTHTAEPKKKNRKLPFIIGGAVVAVAVVVTIILLTSGCKHDWKAATCTMAARCSKCGETKGIPLGHIADGATCTEGEICEVCGKELGSPNGHNPGDWEIVEEATVYSDGEKGLKCTVCGEIIETTTYSLDSFATDDGFAFTGTEFFELFEDNVDLDVELAHTDDGSMIIMFPLSDGGKKGAFLSFGTGIDYNNADNKKPKEVTIKIHGETEYEASEQMWLAQILACDTSMNESSAKELLTSTLLPGASSSGYKSVNRNGLLYEFRIDEWFTLTIFVD